MRYGLDDKLWVVVDPTPQSTLGDILFQASLRDLSLQFKGGLSVDENPTLFTDEQEAVVEVHRRLEPNAAPLSIEALEGCLVLDERHDDVSIVGRLLLSDDHVIAV